MIKALFTAVLVTAVAILLQGPSFADDQQPQVGADSSSFDASATAASSSVDHQGPPVPTEDAGHWMETDVSCPLSLAGTCGGSRTCPGNQPAQQLDYVLPDGTVTQSIIACPGKGPTGPTVADIERAFKALPMRPSTIHIQPPGGETLVNFDSIFYTEPFALDQSLHLLGSTVDFHITVASYTWHYGDGHTQTTTDPGAAYPTQTITHRYLKKGSVSVSLDTVYQADYSIDGGPTQHLDDTVTISSPPQQLTILTATPHLVSD